MTNLILYGGSFDPLHFGHLKTALAVQLAFQFKHFIFLPCKTSFFKKMQASCAQRVQMLKLGLSSYPQFQIDLREIERDTPSYMVETLESFRNTWGSEVSITILLGMDAFIQLPSWHRWEAIFALSHVLVLQRPHFETSMVSPTLQTQILGRITQDKEDLFTHSCGKIMYYFGGKFDISSSFLRQQIQAGNDISAYVTENVDSYIKEQGLYR